MHIQINSDSNTESSADLVNRFKAAIAERLFRFSDQLTRVEVHLSDQDSENKDSKNDKRCLVEARLAGLQPISVSDSADTVERAMDGAIKKLISVLDSSLGRLGRRE